MKKFVLIISILLLPIMSGCGDTFKGVESDLEIKISGTPDMKISGHYAFVSTGEVPRPNNVEGIVPAQYKGKGITALCLFRKTSNEGSLKVEIFRDGKVIAASETQSPLGIVSLSTPPPNVDSFAGQILNNILVK